MPEGGLIILGLDEHNDFIPVGLSDVATLEQGIAGQAREAVTPPVACAFSTHSVDGADVLVVEVEGLPLMSRPARYRGYAYLRQSDGDYRMSDLEVAQIDARKAHRLHDIPRPDAEPVVGTKTDDLDTDLVAVYTDASRSASRRLASRTSEEILRMTGVVTSLGELSLAGLYALGAFPQGFRPALGVTAAVRAPSRGMRTRDLIHFTALSPTFSRTPCSGSVAIFPPACATTRPATARTLLSSPARRPRTHSQRARPPKPRRGYGHQTRRDPHRRG